MRISDWSSDVCSSDLAGLLLNANYGYLHTKYDEGSPGFPKGNAFAQAPKHTVNLSANYTRALGEAGELAASAGYTYHSRVSFQDANLGSALAFQTGYSLLDARLGLNRIDGTNINASVFAKRSEERRVGKEGVSTCRSRWG